MPALPMVTLGGQVPRPRIAEALSAGAGVGTQIGANRMQEQAQYQAMISQALAQFGATMTDFRNFMEARRARGEGREEREIARMEGREEREGVRQQARADEIKKASLELQLDEGQHQAMVDYFEDRGPIPDFLKEHMEKLYKDKINLEAVTREEALRTVSDMIESDLLKRYPEFAKLDPQARARSVMLLTRPALAGLPWMKAILDYETEERMVERIAKNIKDPEKLRQFYERVQAGRERAATGEREPYATTTGEDAQARLFRTYLQTFGLEKVNEKLPAFIRGRDAFLAGDYEVAAKELGTLGPTMEEVKEDRRGKTQDRLGRAQRSTEEYRKLSIRLRTLNTRLSAARELRQIAEVPFDQAIRKLNTAIDAARASGIVYDADAENTLLEIFNGLEAVRKALPASNLSDTQVREILTELNGVERDAELALGARGDPGEAGMRGPKAETPPVISSRVGTGELQPGETVRLPIGGRRPLEPAEPTAAPTGPDYTPFGGPTGLMGKPTEQRPDDLKAAELVPDRRAPDYMRFHNRIIDLEQSVHKLMGDMDAPPQEGWGNRAMDSLSLMRAGAAGMDPSGGPASVLPADKDSIVAEIQRIRNPGGLFAPTPVSDEEFEEVLVRTTATYQQFHKLIAREVSELSLRALGHETDDQVQYQQQIIAGRISEVMREVHNLWGAWLRQEAIKNGIDILDMEAAQGLHPDHVGLMYRLAGMSDRSLATLGIELWQHESARRGLEVYPPDPEMILGIRRAG